MGYFEDIKIKKGETLSQIAAEYGYQSKDWKKIWQHPRNLKLTKKRGEPRRVVEGDIIYIPINWKMTQKKITAQQNNRYEMKVKRNGEKGKRIRWVQTVFQDNQPVKKTKRFCTDACPPDDDAPFYWTRHELKNDSSLRKTFSDTPWRNAPSSRTTNWRAVLSLVVVTDKRVSIVESIVWGIDFGKDGKNKPVGPRRAKKEEVSSHIKLLKLGKGIVLKGGKKIPTAFKTSGWTFRKAKK